MASFDGLRMLNKIEERNVRLLQKYEQMDIELKNLTGVRLEELIEIAKRHTIQADGMSLEVAKIMDSLNK